MTTLSISISATALLPHAAHAAATGIHTLQGIVQSAPHAGPVVPQASPVPGGGAPIPGGDAVDTINQGNSNLVGTIQRLAFWPFVGMIVVVGFMLMLSRGRPKLKEAAHDAGIGAAIGFAIIWLALPLGATFANNYKLPGQPGSQAPASVTTTYGGVQPGSGPYAGPGYGQGSGGAQTLTQQGAGQTQPAPQGQP